MALNGTSILTTRAVANSMLYSLEQGLGETWFAPLIRRVTSDQPDGETHSWLGGVPGMSEQKGDPNFDKLMAPTFWVRNVPFVAGITVPRADWLFNRGGQIQARIDDMVPQALNHPGDLVMDLIASAESTNCYDGQYYFDTDHSEGSSGTQSNDLTYSAATGTTPTAAEMKAAILQALAAMWAFKDDKGNLCNINAKEFVVGAPAALYPTLLEAIGAIIYVGGSTSILNPNNQHFMLTPQILPRVTGDKVYLFRKRAPNMGSAFVHQILLPTEPEILGIESEYCKLHGKLLFKLAGTYNVGLGRWQDACLTTFT